MAKFGPEISVEERVLGWTGRERSSRIYGIVDWKGNGMVGFCENGHETLEFVEGKF
jgi:hypothetical protein